MRKNYQFTLILFRTGSMEKCCCHLPNLQLIVRIDIKSSYDLISLKSKVINLSLWII